MMLLCLPILVTAQSPAELTLSIHLRENVAGPYPIAWNSEIGEEYDVLATVSLKKTAKVTSFWNRT